MHDQKKFVKIRNLNFQTKGKDNVLLVPCGLEESRKLSLHLLEHPLVGPYMPSIAPYTAGLHKKKIEKRTHINLTIPTENCTFLALNPHQ